MAGRISSFSRNSDFDQQLVRAAPDDLKLLFDGGHRDCALFHDAKSRVCRGWAILLSWPHLKIQGNHAARECAIVAARRTGAIPAQKLARLIAGSRLMPRARRDSCCLSSAWWLPSASRPIPSPSRCQRRRWCRNSRWPCPRPRTTPTRATGAKSASSAATRWRRCWRGLAPRIRKRLQFLRSTRAAQDALPAGSRAGPCARTRRPKGKLLALRYRNGSNVLDRATRSGDGFSVDRAAGRARAARADEIRRDPQLALRRDRRRRPVRRGRDTDRRYLLHRHRFSPRPAPRRSLHGGLRDVLRPGRTGAGRGACSPRSSSTGKPYQAVYFQLRRR